jgi:trehalose-phosphatase
MPSKTKMMGNIRYFFDRFADQEHLSKIRRARKISLFLDFDGTLVPIQKDPSESILPDVIKKQLKLLAASNRFFVSILSGRALADIRKKVGIRKIYYGGNHGLEISGPALRYNHPAAVSTRPLIGQVKVLLERAIETIEGAWLEDKKFSLTLHLRSVRTKDIPAVKKRFYEIAAPFLERKQLSVMKGKKVLELTPNVSWNKGSAVLWMMKHFNINSLPIYVGDDLTDETAFEALGDRGISVRAGISDKTSANYYLEGQWEISRFLRACWTENRKRPFAMDKDGD